MTPQTTITGLPALHDPAQPHWTNAGVGGSPEAEAGGASVSHLYWVVRRHRWKILAFVAVSVIATVVISSRLTPMYEATATVDIDREMPTGIVGQESHRTASNDADQFLTTQLALIESDSVLRPVADKYNLREVESADDSEYEPRRSHDAPVLLKRLKLGRPANTYLLKISYRSSDPKLAADVSNAVAYSYLEHTYNIRFRSSASLSAFMEKQLEELKAKMELSGAALSKFEQELNVINPEEKTSIVSARLLQLNAEYTNAQADRVRKEAIYNMSKDGSQEALQVASLGAPLTGLTDKLNEAKQRFSEVRSHFGALHPEYRRASEQVAEIERELQDTRKNIEQRIKIDYQGAVNRESMLQKAVSETKGEFDRMNAHSFEYQSLKREADTDKKLYQELVQKIREAGINAGFQNSSIRIADEARPPLKPVSPKVPLNALMAFLFSSLVALSVAVTSDLVSVSVRDPEQISRLLNLEVLGTLPAVRWLGGKRLAIPQTEGSSNNGNGVVRMRGSVLQNLRQYEQAVQTLRNSVLLADFDRRLRTLMITSAAPFEGKSTIASHFAIANAKSGLKTLLIDGDLRRPSIQRILDLESEKGLADVLGGDLPWKDALIQKQGTENLDILLAGSVALRSPELMGSRLLALMDEVRKSYDLVILDSPPVHGFPEPLRMATAVDGVIVVAVANRTSRKALSASVAMLARLRARVLGVVLNRVNVDSSESGYYAYAQTKNYYKA